VIWFYTVDNFRLDAGVVVPYSAQFTCEIHMRARSAVVGTL